MIVVKNVTKTYYNKDGSVVKALKGVNLELPDTGVVFVVGASGNGKSTLLNILAGLDRFDGGDVLVDGKSFKNFTNKDFDEYRRRKIGFVFEESNLIDSLSVKENIKIGRVLNGDVPTDDEINEVLKKVKLTDYEDRSVTQLSAGQKQRVSIARILIKNPDILFMDEPTAHLDDKNTQIIWSMVREIAKTCLVVTVSHNMPLVEKYGDRVVSLENNIVGENREIKRTGEKEKPAKKDSKKDSKDLKPAELVKPEKVEEPKKFKHSLDFMYSLKLAVDSLMYRRWRTIFMVILCTLAVTFFSIFSVVSSYNQNYALAVAANDTITATSTMKITPYVHFQKGNLFTQSSVKKEDVASLKANELKNYDLFEFKKAHYSVQFYEYLKADHQGYAVSGIISADPAKATANKTPLGQSILYGAYPVGTRNVNDVTITEANGVVISDYMLAMIKHYGLLSNGAYHIPRHADYTDTDRDHTYWDENLTDVPEDTYIRTNIIGADICLGGQWYVISGIYATDYTSFVDTSKMVFASNNSHDMFVHNMANIYSVVQVTPSFSGFSLDARGDVMPYTTSVIISTTQFDAPKLQGLIEDMTDYIFVSSTSGTIANVSNYISIFKTMIIFIAVFTAVFAIVMMYYFISQIILDRRKDVGVLKALGFSNRDISMIFLISTALFVLFAFGFTLVITSVAAAFANASVKQVLLIAFKMLNVNMLVVLYMFIVCILIAALGAIIPLIQFSKKKPNEILKGVFK